MKPVLLINMPFVSLSRPAIGISILKAALHRQGLPCDIAYPNLLFADLIGVDLYTLLDERVSDALFVGDWLFAQHMFKDQLDVQTYIHTLRHFIDTPNDFERIMRVKDRIGEFLEQCIDAYHIADYRIIGFTSTFEQNMASLACSRLIKARFPDKVIVFGGANCEGEMGLELHKRFSWIDYVCTREGETCFPELVQAVLHGHSTTGIRGMVYRDGTESIDSGPAVPVKHMDEIPVPDYDDYFAALRLSKTFDGVISPSLLVETSRGCWWGVKNHCTFCGLNGDNMNFRSKSPGRVVEELQFLVERYGISQFMAVDNIIDLQYFKNVLPALVEKQLGIRLFYETKANLTKEQVKLLSDSGVKAIQPGVESLSAHVLQLMRKGVSPIQNIQLLKWCKEYNVQVAWNLLYGFPGETTDDYEEIKEYIDALFHLSPPHSVGAVRMDRFSPYFNESDKYGMINVRPFGIYKLIYPLPDESLKKIVYFFEYDYASGQQSNGYIGHVMEKVTNWKNAGGCNLTVEYRNDPEMVITDTRPNRVHDTIGLNGVQREVYAYCDQKRSVATIMEFVSTRYTLPENFEPWLRGFLELMTGWRVMVKERDTYLSLGIPV